MNLFLNILELLKLLIPTKIRGEKFEAWIGSLLQPIQSLNTDFSDWGEDVRYNLRFNGEVMYLEHILNDQFDPVDRLIYIDDPDTYIDENFVFNKLEPETTLIVYNKAEAQPSLFLYTSDDLSQNVDFVVYVLVSIFNPANEVQMRGIINKRRPAGKRYKFETF